MPYRNECRVRGHLGSEPKINQTKSGTPVANFSIATTIKKKDGEESTTWHRCVVWGEPATWCETWQKGDYVEVCGSYSSRTWTDRAGAEREPFELTAIPFNGVENFRDFERRKGGQQRAPQPAPAAASDDDLAF